MIPQHSLKAFAAGLLALSASSGAFASDQAKAILNSIDSKSMNELLDVSKNQPDAALTNIAPVSANTFRFLFVWPASNSLMTYERVGRSFAERFAVFADRLNLLVTGFCLTSNNMFFGTTSYGEDDVNVAYRDIEVHYLFGWQPPCSGRYISITEVEQSLAPAALPGYGAVLPPPLPPANQMTAPDESLKPFLSPQPGAPLE